MSETAELLSPYSLGRFAPAIDTPTVAPTPSPTPDLGQLGRFGSAIQDTPTPTATPDSNLGRFAPAVFAPDAPNSAAELAATPAPNPTPTSEPIKLMSDEDTVKAIAEAGASVGEKPPQTTETWLDSMGITDPKERALFTDLPNRPQGERPPFAEKIAGWLDYVANKVTGGASGADTAQNLVREGTYVPKPGEASFMNAGIPMVPPQTGKAAQVGAGLANIPIGFANFLLSPGGAATAGGLGALPKVAKILTGAGFTAEQIRDFFNAKTLQDKITTGVGAALLGTLTGVGAVTKGGEPNASGVTSTESVSQPEVRPQVGQETPLRQQGEVAGARPAEEPLQPAEAQPGDVISQPATEGGESATAAPLESGAATPDVPTILRVAGRRFKGATQSEAYEKARQELAPDMSLGEFSDAVTYEPDFFLERVPRPETDAEYRARLKSEASARGEYLRYQRRAGDELFKTISLKGGLPTPSSPHWVAELEGLWENPKAKRLFRKGAPPLDRLREGLQEAGFPFELPDDMIAAIDARARGGNPVFGNFSAEPGPPIVGAPALAERGAGGPGAAHPSDFATQTRWQGLRDWLFRRGAEPEEGRANYSGLGAIRTWMGQGLRETEKANEPIYMAARRTAGSSAQARNMLNDAAGAVRRSIGRGMDGWNEFKAVLVESRLRGIRQRWDDMSKSVLEASDKELSGEMGDHMVDLLSHIRGRMEGEDPLATAIALKQEGDFSGLRRHLSDTFALARDRVGRIWLPRPFEQMIAEPKMQSGLATYKNLIETPLKENHALNEGVFSDALGPLDTYFPLTATSQVEPTTGRVGYGGRLLPFRKPMNARNKFATGLSPAYDLGDEPLHKAVAIAVRMNNTAALIQTLHDEGFIHKLKPDEPGQSTIEIGGQDYQASTVPIGPQRLVKDKFGRTQVIPQQKAVVPIWLANELRPVLESAKFTKYDVVNILDKINNYAVAGPLIATIHTSNVVGAMVGGTPWAGTGILSKTIGNTPVTKVFTSIANLMRQEPTSPESIAKIQEMAKLGVIPTSYSNPRNIGIFSKFLFGTKGLDIRARLLAYDIFKQVEPNGGKAELIKFLDQFGNYVPQMNGVVERYLKANRVAPFYEAGKQMYLNGIKSVLGTTPMPRAQTLAGRFGLRLAQQLSGGTAGVLGTWAVAYKAYTGLWPWDDKRAKLMQFPLNKSDRQSALAQKLYGPGNNTAYVKMDFFAPSVGRGLRALGARGFSDEVATGSKFSGLGVEAGMKDAINSFLHPVTSSPVLRAGMVALTGHEPELSSMRDITGNFGPEFYKRTNKKTPGIPQIAENVKQGAIDLNSFARSIADGVGLGVQSFHKEDEKQDTGGRILRMAVDTMFPRLLGFTSDVDKRLKSQNRLLKASTPKKKAAQKSDFSNLQLTP